MTRMMASKMTTVEVTKLKVRETARKYEALVQREPAPDALGPDARAVETLALHRVSDLRSRFEGVQGPMAMRHVAASSETVQASDSGRRFDVYGAALVRVRERDAASRASVSDALGEPAQHSAPAEAVSSRHGPGPVAARNPHTNKSQCLDVSRTDSASKPTSPSSVIFPRSMDMAPAELCSVSMDTVGSTCGPQSKRAVADTSDEIFDSKEATLVDAPEGIESDSQIFTKTSTASTAFVRSSTAAHVSYAALKVLFVTVFAILAHCCVIVPRIVARLAWAATAIDRNVVSDAMKPTAVANDATKHVIATQSETETDTETESDPEADSDAELTLELDMDATPAIAATQEAVNLTLELKVNTAPSVVATDQASELTLEVETAAKTALSAASTRATVGENSPRRVTKKSKRPRGYPIRIRHGKPYDVDAHSKYMLYETESTAYERRKATAAAQRLALGAAAAAKSSWR